MKNTFLFFFFLLNVAFDGISQVENRVTLAGSRISIKKPANTLISKHTSTIYIDSTIEFMLAECPSIEEVKRAMNLDLISPERTEIKEEFELEVLHGSATVLITRYNSVKDYLHCYMGDSTFGVWSSCIYKREDSSIRDRVLETIQSIRIIDAPEVDWHSYLAFSYDRNNKMKLVPIMYVTGMRFTPNGVLNDSLFNATNIASLQFPPAPEVKSSKDLLMAGISGQLMDMTINDVLFDGEIIINEQEAYKFWANCSVGEHEFELIYVAFYDPKSSVILNCHIVDGEYQNDVYDFVSSVELKRDGY
jgi:hypothetical protein